jgi:hypothetical protein
VTQKVVLKAANDSKSRSENDICAEENQPMTAKEFGTEILMRLSKRS